MFASKKTLEEALDTLPKNLGECKPEDVRGLTVAVFALEEETEQDKDVVVRLTKVVDRLCMNYSKRGVMPAQKGSKKKISDEEKKEEEGKEDGEAKEEKNEEEDKEEEKEAEPVDMVKYHKELVYLAGTVQNVQFLSPQQARKMHGSLRLLVTEKENNQAKKQNKTDKDKDIVLTSEVLDAIRIIQKFKVGGPVGNNGKKTDDTKKKRARRQRKPREAQGEKVAEGEKQEQKEES